MSPDRLKLWAKTTDEVIKANAITIRLLHLMTLLAKRRNQLVQLTPETGQGSEEVVDGGVLLVKRLQLTLKKKELSIATLLVSLTQVLPDLTSGTQTNNVWLDRVVDADHQDGSNTGLISTPALKSVYGILKGLISSSSSGLCLFLGGLIFCRKCRSRLSGRRLNRHRRTRSSTSEMSLEEETIERYLHE